MVHALLVKSKSKESSLPIDMPKMTESTGGEAIRADQPGTAFEELMERVRRRYSILYALPKGAPEQQRTVRVELSEAARKQYPEGDRWSGEGMYRGGCWVNGRTSTIALWPRRGWG